jgi:hypothetical protein
MKKNTKLPNRYGPTVQNIKSVETQKCTSMDPDDTPLKVNGPVMHFTLFYTIEPGSLHRSCSFMELASQCMGAAPIAAFIA